MPTDEIINPAVNMRGRRWQIFQLVGPILGVLLVIGSIMLVTLHTYHTMREGAMSLSRDLLKSQQRYITGEVSRYLSPASGIALTASDLLKTDDISRNAAAFMALGRSALGNMPQVDSFFLADDRGHFWMSARRGNAYEETTLCHEEGAPYYCHKITDRDGRFLSADSFSAEGYDPRQRLWYKGAVAREHESLDNRLYWTDPYPYLSTHQFIVTASMVFRSPSGHRIVFAISISLNQLTRFVNSLKVGKSGQAVIVDVDGHVIAGHNMTPIGLPGFDASNVHLDPVTQPVFLRALNVFKVRGDGTGVVHARGQNYVTIASAMPIAKRSWVLLLNAPEDDFASFTRVVKRQTVYFSFLIVGLASILALALVYQGRRVEKYQTRLRDEEDKKRQDSAVLLKITNMPGLLDSQQEVPYLCEALVGQASAKRASIWRLLPDGTRLICEDMFNRDQGTHGSGMELTKSAHPGLFACLNDGHYVDIPDASWDSRFESVQRVFMQMIGARRLFVLPVFEEHHPVGLIMLEDSVQLRGVERVIALISSVVAVRLGQAQKAESEEAVPQHLTTPFGGGQSKAPMKVVEGFLVQSHEENKTDLPAVGLYPEVPIMVLEFSEAYSSNRETAKTMLALMSEMSEKIQDISQRTRLFSVQVAGNRFIFLGSCVQSSETDGVLHLADAAILIREACLTVISRMSTRLMFRMGVDVGAILVAHLGKNHNVFNLWGEGLRMAETLAHNAPDGGQIQVSERAYLEMRRHFLFRPRGDFYLPGSGITRSYILAGRR